MLPPTTLLGFVLASLAAGVAWRARWLAPSGAAGAVVVGTAAVAAGWGWAGVLVAFFLSSSLLSRWKREAKALRTSAIVEKGGTRDLMQVLANGGVFAALAVLSLVHPADWVAAAALGALGTATADTWATEVGTAIGGTPRSLRGWRPVPPGTSGAVTAAGSAAMCAGAVFLGTVARAAGFDAGMAVAAAGGGVAGALVDTVLGATIQERRWCTTCTRETERHVHDCGTPTRRHRGMAGVGNDVVNLTSCLAGSATAAFVLEVMR